MEGLVRQFKMNTSRFLPMLAGALSLLTGSAIAQGPTPSPKWMLVSHVDSGPTSNLTFSAWLDTTHVERLRHGAIGVWMLTDNARVRSTFANHMVIDCNLRRYYVDEFLGYNEKGERTESTALYTTEPKPLPEDAYQWWPIDPVTPSWDDRVALQACRRWVR